jgi:hypothetical protein
MYSKLDLIKPSSFSAHNSIIANSGRRIKIIVASSHQITHCSTSKLHELVRIGSWLGMTIIC